MKPYNLEEVADRFENEPRLCAGCGRDVYGSDLCPACSQEGITHIDEGRIRSKEKGWNDER
jgi:predicted amidophosphoribosyltransferase